MVGKSTAVAAGMVTVLFASLMSSEAIAAGNRDFHVSACKVASGTILLNDFGQY
jgi:hypothetical protein